MIYDYNQDLSTKNYEIKIATLNRYGYFEHHRLGEDSAGGMWFSTTGELTDYDGVFALPREVALALLAAGYVVSSEFFSPGEPQT